MQTDYSNIDFGVMNMANLMPSPKDIKAVTYRKGQSTLKDDMETVTYNEKLLDMAYQYWMALQDFRDRRLRSRKYYRGDQWHEVITDPDTGDAIAEEDYIKNQGKVPFKQNMIRQVVKNILGQYRQNPVKSMVISRAYGKGAEADMLTNALRSALDVNKANELDVRNFEEHLLSGAAIGKVRYKYWKERNTEDVWVENINPARCFFNSGINDIRVEPQLTMIGEIEDDELDNVIGAFAKNEADAEKIRRWYTNMADKVPMVAGDTLSPDQLDSLDFYIPYDTTRVRVIELWYLKSEWRTYVHDPLDGTYNIVPYSIDEVTQFNQQRIMYAAQNGIPPEQVPLMTATRKYEQYWCFKYLTPWGHTLAEGETPFGHDSHPYILTLYPLLDGEAWGFIEDIIDQQRYINRMISMIDSMMGAAAKGVLMVPEGAMGDMTPQEFATEWTKFNGVIIYKPRQDGQIPHQINSSSVPVGAWEMLNTQMKLIQDISGVHEALQGQTPKSGTPSSLYAQQAQYSITNLKEYMEFFAFYKEQRDLKILKVLRQYYTDRRYMTAGSVASDPEKMVYDPERVRNLEVELKVSPSTDTPVYRQVIDDMLFQLLQAQMIDITMFLENSSLPFAERLLEQIRQRQQDMAQQGGIPAGGAITPDMMAQVQQMAQQQGNPQAMQMLQQAMGQ